MNYVLFGSPRFAATILEDLITIGLPPQAVVTSPDRPAGRKKELTPPEVKVLAEKHGIPVYQPESLKKDGPSPLFHKADFFVVAAYAKIIPDEILSLPRLGTLGIHPSLLPHFRGPTPIQSTLLAGHNEAGVTIYQMDALIDHGPVIAEAALERYTPDTDDYGVLEEKLAYTGAKLFRDILAKYPQGNWPLAPQDEAEATMTKKFKTSDAMILESDLREAMSGNNIQAAQAVLRKILAFSREPGAWTILEKPFLVAKNTLPAGLRIKLLKAKLSGNRLDLLAFQIEGKKPQVISS